MHVDKSVRVQDPKASLDLKQNADKVVFVKDLTNIVVKSVLEIDHVMMVTSASLFSDSVRVQYPSLVLGAGGPQESFCRSHNDEPGFVPVALDFHHHN